jgi:hypothetical protein
MASCIVQKNVYSFCKTIGILLYDSSRCPSFLISPNDHLVLNTAKKEFQHITAPLIEQRDLYSWGFGWKLPSTLRAYARANDGLYSFPQ